MRGSILCSLLLLAVPAGINASTTPGPYSDVNSAPLTASFSIQSPTAIPGKTLKAGTYTMEIVDHLRDRLILRVVGPNGKVESIFLAVENPAILRPAPGPLAWNAGSHHENALRGFTFPGRLSVEFVFPKAEAVELAKANSDKVEAIDPASDNLPSNVKELSSEDMQIVTLWTLTPSKVGADGKMPAISAVKYQPPATAPKVMEAKNSPPLNPSVAMAASQRATRTSGNAAPVRKPIVSSLPHTASDQPLTLLIGFTSLLLIGFIRLGRSVTNVS